MTEDADVDYMMVLQGEVRELRTENERLRAALKPFAETEVVAGIAWPSSCPTADDFRRAREALK